jgi:4-hydroxy-tetrahydrodipicolinate reductase
MNNPIRVLVWGPGGLGNICIREVIRLPEFELAGVLAYSADKDGVDAGNLAGAEQAGVLATTDFAIALSTECDVVIHLARDYGRFGAVDEIVEFLRVGRNVITVHPFQHIEAYAATAAPADTLQRIETACAEGGSTFHSTGINPEMIADRMAATLTGLCTDVRNVKAYENWDHAHFNNKTLSVVGFGKRPEDVAANPAIAQMINNYCLQNLYGLAAALDADIATTRVEHDYACAPRELRFPTITLQPGTVGRLTHTWHGYRADDTEPLITVEVNWMLGRKEMVPAGMDPAHYYGVVIEGTPSASMGISIVGSLRDGRSLVEPNDPTSEPGYYGAVATCLQAIPRTLRADAGILGPARPELHWTRDFRNLAGPRGSR